MGWRVCLSALRQGTPTVVDHDLTLMSKTGKGWQRCFGAFYGFGHGVVNCRQRVAAYMIAICARSRVSGLFGHVRKAGP